MRRQLPRYGYLERALHWASAFSFLYATFTGLALWSHKLYWLAAVFGGGSATRLAHPWAGLVFALVFGMICKNWARYMRFEAADRQWLAQSHRYAMNDEDGLPESGRFNAGQKMLFWFQVLAGGVLLLTGLVLWFPEYLPRFPRLLAIALHPLAGLGAIGMIILHIYMSVFAVPGALTAMIRGTVSEGWARAHHPKWLREITNGR
jgi:formate dehydrogenase subunit gamma